MRFLLNRGSKTIPIIIAINIMVFCFWMFAQFGLFSVSFMAENFLVSWLHLEEGNYWVLITSVFSHNMFFHIFLNMYVLLSFGPIVEGLMGTKSFVRFYLIAGIISSFSHAFVSKWLMDSPELPALGASGAIAGVIILFSLSFPKEKILLFGIIPLPAITAALLFVGLDLWGLSAQAGGGGLPIGHGAHLGGALTGLIFYLLFYRQRKTVIY